MLAISNEELDNMPTLGKTIQCSRCGKRHHIKYSDKILEDGSKVKGGGCLAFYKCKGKFYLAGINGKEFRPN